MIDSNSAFCPKCGASLASRAFVTPGSTSANVPPSTQTSTPPAKKITFSRIVRIAIIAFVIVIVRGYVLPTIRGEDPEAKRSSSITFDGVDEASKFTFVDPDRTIPSGSSSTSGGSSGPTLEYHSPSSSSGSSSSVPSNSSSGDYSSPVSDYGSSAEECIVDVVSARVAEDIDGDLAIAITYSFANNSDSMHMFMVMITDKVTQNGVALEPTILSMYDPEYDIMGGWYMTADPGETAEGECIYKLLDTVTKVEVELTPKHEGISANTMRAVIDLTE